MVFRHVPDPDLEITGGGGGAPPRNFLGLFRPQFGLKIRGGQPPWPAPLGLPLSDCCKDWAICGNGPQFVICYVSVFLCTLKVFTQNAVDALSRLAELIHYVLYFELVEALFFGWKLLSWFSDGGQGSLSINPLTSPLQWSQTFQDQAKDTLYI